MRALSAPCRFFTRKVSNSRFYNLGGRSLLSVSGESQGNLFDSCYYRINNGIAKDNVFLKNYKLYSSQWGDREYWTSKAEDWGYSIIPPWVLSTTILLRIQKLLERMERSFEFTEDDLNAPRGQINWTRYATANIPRAGFMNVPCRFPDLKDNREIKGAIHYTLRKQLSSLQSQRTAGVIVLQLLGLFQSLLEKVRNVPAIMPTQHTMGHWLQGNLSTEIFRQGIQAVPWTVEDRGLAGLGDLQGLPWVLPMDRFFEAWVETVAHQLARGTGGILKRGRQRETLTPLSWSPPYLGSQRYLLPDLVLEREGETIIIDAKYKNHWEELNRESWAGLEKELRERHREDLLQVLAYSTASESKRVVCCLAYPCREQTWHSLLKRQRLFHKAAVRAGNRRVELILTAVPMGINPEEIWPELRRAISA